MLSRISRELADMVTEPRINRPWRPAPPPPLTQADLSRVLAGLRNLNRPPLQSPTKGSKP
jgi:hypothetical protein